MQPSMASAKGRPKHNHCVHPIEVPLMCSHTPEKVRLGPVPVRVANPEAEHVYAVARMRPLRYVDATSASVLAFPR